MRWALLSVLIAVSASGCGSGQPALPDARPDADLDYRKPVLVTVKVETPDGARVRIAGETLYRYETWVADEAALETTVIDVESVVSDQVASVMTAPVDCDSNCTESWYAHSQVSFVAYASGELRYGGIVCDGVGTTCFGDVWLRALCYSADDCEPGEKCGLARLPFDSTHGWLDCVPEGARSMGQSCAIDGSGEDDCGDGLHCYQAVCRQACIVDCTPFTCAALPSCAPGDQCTHLDGMSPEVGVCPLPTAAE